MQAAAVEIDEATDGDTGAGAAGRTAHAHRSLDVARIVASHAADAAMPRAWRTAPVSSPSTRAAAAAAPIVPMDDVQCHPRP